jgi:hypothetical protein
MKWVNKPETLRSSILTECNRLKTTYNLEVYPYGTGRQGARKLRGFLDGESNKITKEVHKRAHEFWTFLMLLEVVLERSKFQRLEQAKLVGFQLANDAPVEFGGEVIANHSFWWEPYLPAYNEKTVIGKYRGKLNFLQSSESIHQKPDLLVLRGEHETLPFPAIGPGKIFLGEPFSTTRWEIFQNLKNDILWLIECKDDELAEQDLVRFIWYAAAYQVPSLLIIQDSMPYSLQKNFNQDVVTLNELGVKVRIIDHFDVGERDYCLSNLSRLFE